MQQGRDFALGGSAGVIAIAAGAAAATALLSIGFGAGPTGWIALALVPVVAWIARQDVADFTIPDAAVVALAALGTVARLVDGAVVGEPLGLTAMAVAVDVAVCGGLLFALREVYYRRRGQDGIGFGDVKLGAAGAVLTGATGFAWALFAASLAGIAVALASRRRGPRSLPPAPEKLPFGALLAPALWLTWLLGQSPALSWLMR